MRVSPCIRCGACCASYKVTLAVGENAVGVGAVPEAMTVPLKNGPRRAMKGTEGSRPRCAVLQGSVGGAVSCSIYADRPKACRDFLFSGENDRINPLCDRARRIYGLMPLVSEDF